MWLGLFSCIVKQQKRKIQQMASSDDCDLWYWVWESFFAAATDECQSSFLNRQKTNEQTPRKQGSAASPTIKTVGQLCPLLISRPSRLQVTTCETRTAQPLVPFPEKQGATVSFHALFAQHVQGQDSTCAQL